jgi:hypothetical protein
VGFGAGVGAGGGVGGVGAGAGVGATSHLLDERAGYYYGNQQTCDK